MSLKIHRSGLIPSFLVYVVKFWKRFLGIELLEGSLRLGAAFE